MQNPNTPHSAPASYDNGSTDAPVDNSEPFVPPRIPVGLPHVVQFVEGSLYHLPQTIQNVGQKMSGMRQAAWSPLPSRSCATSLA